MILDYTVQIFQGIVAIALITVLTTYAARLLVRSTK